jgi:major vault protein
MERKMERKMEVERTSKDIVVPRGKHVYILKDNSAKIQTIVGASNLTLQGNDIAVTFDGRQFQQHTDSLQALMLNWVVPENFYCVLKNPTKLSSEGEYIWPEQDTVNNVQDLEIGKEIVVHGPETIVPWPGQIVELRRGHRLRQNQFLTVSINDVDAAKKIWEQVMGEALPDDEDDAQNTIKMGNRYIIKGTDTQFFMPMTGFKVMPVTNDKGQKLKDTKGRIRFIHEAVTLNARQYCKLQHDNGKHRTVPGPDVVFPTPDETFIKNPRKQRDDDDPRIFNKYELDEIKGLHLKVVEDFTEEVQERYKTGDKKGELKDKPKRVHRKAGDELWITGADANYRLYTPPAEVTIIRYGGDLRSDVHFGTVVPEGNGRYLLNRKSGEVDTITGPKVVLPDPRDLVFTRRILTDPECALYYPENPEVLAFNQALREAADGGTRITDEEVMDKADQIRSHLLSSGVSARSLLRKERSKSSMRGAYAPEERIEDDFSRGMSDVEDEAIDRGTKYTEPREVDLTDTKFKGVPRIRPWEGFAVNVVSHSSSGEELDRRIVVGPANVLLGFNESLQSMELSTDTPKNHDEVVRVGYLRINNNMVSDEITLETKDLVTVDVDLTFFVEFVGDTNEDRLRWWGAENYIKLLVEFYRSVLRGAAKKHTIKDFNDRGIEIIRDAILTEKPAEGDRHGRMFAENNMRVYEVTVDTSVEDATVANMLGEHNRQRVEEVINMAREENRLEATKAHEKIEQQMSSARAATKTATQKLERDRMRSEADTEKQRLEIGRNHVALQAEHALAEFKDNQTRIELRASFQLKNHEQEMVLQMEKVKSGIEQSMARLTGEIVELPERQKLIEHRIGEERDEKQLEHDFNEKSVALEVRRIEADVKSVVDKMAAVSPELASTLQAFADEFMAAKMAEFGSYRAVIGGENIMDSLMGVLGDTSMGRRVKKLIHDEGNGVGQPISAP